MRFGLIWQGTRSFHWGNMTVATKMTGHVLPKMKFDLQPDTILQMTESTLKRCVGELDKVGAIRRTECTFATAIWPIAQLEQVVRTELSACGFLQHVSTDEHVRSASMEATKLIERYEIDKETREDLFQITKAVAENEKEMNALDKESRRLVEKMMLQFRHNGLFLDQEKRGELKRKRQRLADLAVDFSKIMGEDRTELLLSKEELEGCPVDFLEGLEQRDGKYVLTMKYPDVFGVLKHAKKEDIRRQMDIAFNSKCRENGPILEEAIELRRQCAQLLGYDNHAVFQLEERLARTPTEVINFEKDLQSKLTPIAKTELDRLRALKCKETGKCNVDLYSFDYHLLERDYALDDEKLKEYFSLEMVVPEMLKIYSEVLGLHFERLVNATAWHPDVHLFEVKDQQSMETIGHIYLDLFPRPGKYTHAACFNLQPGCVLDRKLGDRQLPAAAMVANFSKPTASKPSLLKHNEVVTLFHELGHAMHDVCARVTYSRFHGCNVETDFVEAPSQMLENWCWDEAMLKRISRHYLRPEETLPDEMIRQLVLAKNFNAGLMYLRQSFFGIFDMTIHSISKPFSQALPGESIDGLYERLRREIALIPQSPNLSPASSFGHMMGGYDAGYYGYLWSEVFAADMFYSRFKKEGLQNFQTGRDYRFKILAPGGSRNGMESLVDFLGRKPDNEAFMRSHGLQSVQEE